MTTHTLRGFGILGILLFLPVFLFTFADPQLVEHSGRSFVEWKVKQEVFDKIDSATVPNSFSLERMLGDKAKTLHAKAEKELEVYKQRLKNNAPAMIAKRIAEARNLDCECRKKWEDTLRQSLILHIKSIEDAQQKLETFTQAKYMDVVQKLTLDVRIFLGTNALVFLLLLLVSCLKPRAVNHLFLPSAMLLISTLICSYFYLFEQNWFYTILYNDYTGLSFITYLLLVFAFLCDIVFNSAKVTTEIINGILTAIGSTLSVVSC